MDTGNGEFKQLDQAEYNEELLKQLDGSSDGIFCKGEILEIKGSTFRVVSIGKKFMNLKLLPKLKTVETVPANQSVRMEDSANQPAPQKVSPQTILAMANAVISSPIES
jgi:hypothetical protein